MQAFRYLLKSELEEKLPGYYQKALEELQHSADEMTFNANGEQLRIKYQDILYMESRQRVMRLFTLTDTRSRGYFYASMEDTENSWPRPASCGYSAVISSIWRISKS